MLLKWNRLSKRLMVASLVMGTLCQTTGGCLPDINQILGTASSLAIQYWTGAVSSTIFYWINDTITIWFRG